MTLEVIFGAGGRQATVAARQIERTLGSARPMEFCATLGPSASERAALREIVLAEPTVTAELRAAGSGLALPPLRVAGCRELRHGLEVFLRPVVAPVALVRTIDRPRTAAELLATVEDVAAIPTAMKNELSAVKCPLDDKTCYIQDALPESLRMARVQTALAALAAPAGSPLTRVGTTGDPGGNPSLQACWLQRQAYQASNTLEAHRLTFGERDGRDDFEFGTSGDHAAVVHYRRDRSFNAANWSAWCSRKLPLFLADAMIWEVRDRLFVTENEKIGWDSAMVCGHPDDSQKESAPPWTGFGTVEAWQPPWLAVRLIGFLGGRDRAFAKLLTHSSGADGKTGWHAVPYPDSVVELSWSGRLADPLSCHGNRRDQPPRIAAPSLVFDREMNLEVPVLKMKINDHFGIESSRVEIDAGKTIRLGASNSVEVRGGGGEAQWKNGKFFAGKG